MFKQVLQDVVDRTDGAIAGLLMGLDGIPVENYIRDDAPMDVETIGMEFSVILKNIQNAASLLDAGNASEVSIRAEKLTTVIRYLNEEYFVAVAIAPDGNSGKARFLLRTHGPKLLADLV